METYHIRTLRCEAWTDEGIACGPVTITSVVAEAAIENSMGSSLYIVGTWNDGAPDILDFEVFTTSMIDKFIRASGEDIDDICNARNQDDYQHLDDPIDSVFSEVVIEIAKAIKDKIDKFGYLDEDDIIELFDGYL